MSMEAMKRAAAAEALKLVRPGMKLGLGTGSTAKHFVDLLGEAVAGGLSVVGVPTSEATRRQPESLGIPLATLDDLVELDMTIDGADEIDPAMNLIKGGGGAHLREKIVASASKMMVVIADDSKIVSALGRFPLPVEVVRFAEETTRRAITAAFAEEGLACRLVPRMKDGVRFVTDEGNLIVDARLEDANGVDHGGRIEQPARLAERLAAVPGVVEHGLFIGLCSAAYVASQNGVARMDRTS
ncbi:MAG: ribose-5-phosphate isomerase RpiA [Proteobacteria bacterium]|nr:ribose-5-phosphate isomerase RpiA [Pseudomonadota bacterium]